MNRTVVSRGPQVAATQQQADNYVDRLAKYVPPDVIAVFLAVEGAINAAGASQNRVFAWICFLVILVLTPIYLSRVAGITKPKQIVIATVAFFLWAAAYHGPPFLLLTQPPLSWLTGAQLALYSTVVVALYTFLIPLIEV